MEQIIYGRWEYSIGKTPSHIIFDEYRNMYKKNNEGITVAGLDVCIRNDNNRAAIILTYDMESETYMKLKTYKALLIGI
jgi:hypothetical protein